MKRILLILVLLSINFGISYLVMLAVNKDTTAARRLLSAAVISIAITTITIYAMKFRK